MALTKEQKEKMRQRFLEIDGNVASSTGSNNSVKDIIAKARQNQTQQEQPEEKKSTFFSRSADVLKEKAGDIAETFKLSAKSPKDGGINPAEVGIRVVGDVVGGARGVFGALIEPAVKPVVEAIGETETGKIAFEKIGQGIEVYNAWKNENPTNKRIAESLEAVVDIASLFTAVKAVTRTKVGLQTAKQTGKEVIDQGVGIATKGKNFIQESGVGKVIKSKALGAKETVEGSIKRMPINAEAKAIERETIKSLPKASKEALQGGLDLEDVKLVTKAQTLKDKTYSKMKEMVAVAKSGEKDPAEIVGQVFRQPIAKVEEIRKNVGNKLGQIAEGLSKTTRLKTKDNVIKRMKEVKGLEGLKLTAKGELDFSQTSLAGSLTSADRKVLQKAFMDISGKSPKQIHNLRQELFEVLGGKKKAKVELTNMQEQGLEGIRKGLSDSLDEVSSSYRALNQEYARILEPLKEMRKLFKNVEGASDDILDLKASVLARRLTQNAVSNADIKNTLRKLEKILLKKGIKVDADVESLQKFFYALERYYDVTKGGSFAGQVSSGVRNALSKSGLVDTAIKTVTEPFAITKSTQQKFLEKLFGL